MAMSRSMGSRRLCINREWSPMTPSLKHSTGAAPRCCLPLWPLLRAAGEGRVGRKFDADQNGEVSLTELSSALIVFAKGTFREKVALCFQVRAWLCAVLSMCGVLAMCQMLCCVVVWWCVVCGAVW